MQLLLSIACHHRPALLPRPLLSGPGHSRSTHRTPSTLDQPVSMAREGQDDAECRGDARVRSGLRVSEAVCDEDGQERTDERRYVRKKGGRSNGC